MPSQFSRVVGAGIATTLVAALLALGAEAAPAAQGVYGGATRSGDPIVITSDAKGQKLTGVVFRLRVNSPDDWWPVSGKLAVREVPDNPMAIPTGVLVVDRNARGRFAGRLIDPLGASAERAYMSAMQLTGSLKPGKAAGTIKAWVTVTNIATGQPEGVFETDTIKWTARRDPGRVYAGSTANALPIVINLDQRRRKVQDLWFSCFTEQSSPPDMYWSSSETFGDFPLKNGRFGDSFSYPGRYADGTTLDYSWKIAGRTTAKAATGSIAMTLNATQPTGEAFSFTMPATKFTATTG
jgi:hypothetical protein